MYRGAISDNIRQAVRDAALGSPEQAENDKQVHA